MKRNITWTNAEAAHSTHLTIIIETITLKTPALCIKRTNNQAELTCVVNHNRHGTINRYSRLNQKTRRDCGAA